MGKSADDEAQKVYQSFASALLAGTADIDDAHDMAREEAYNFYSLLLDMKVSVYLSALSTVYHQWDKDIRRFLREWLGYYFNYGVVNKFCEQLDQGKIFSELEIFGFFFKKMECYRSITATRLIVNVYKHGHGSSLRALSKEYPRYLTPPFGDRENARPFDAPLLENLSITEAEFDELVGGMRRFWTEFPEHLSAPGA
jgi:hypothetical protein